jgi:DNA repair exonuclease SbcCD ATPase subunit
LSKAAGTPYKTPARGWPARFRHELELLKSAMETYSSSQQQALQALHKEKQRSSQLEHNNVELEATMKARLAEMESVKMAIEAKANETEARLLSLREQIGMQEQHDTEVGKQLSELEAAKSALQLRAARAREEADKLHKQLATAEAQCKQLSHDKQTLEARVQDIPPLQERLQRVAAAKEESEQALERMSTQHRRLLQDAQASAREVGELKASLAEHRDVRAHLDKDVATLRKEKALVIEQLRAADRSGRQAREEGQLLVGEWQQRHAELETALRNKSKQAASAEQACKALKQSLAAAEARQAQGEQRLARMTEMKDALDAQVCVPCVCGVPCRRHEAKAQARTCRHARACALQLNTPDLPVGCGSQVAQLQALDSRRQQETAEVQEAVRTLEASLQKSKVTFLELSCAPSFCICVCVCVCACIMRARKAPAFVAWLNKSSSVAGTLITCLHLTHAANR